LVRNEQDPKKAVQLAYTILQAAGCRSFKTDYVACPSCGRTLFNLQSVTARIKARTGHLTGVKIAIMGCIVNGPGEMADADFGYVGGAPGKINLYVGKQAVKFNIPKLMRSSNSLISFANTGNGKKQIRRFMWTLDLLKSWVLASSSPPTIVGSDQRLIDSKSALILRWLILHNPVVDWTVTHVFLHRS
jgi:hypothetical protein